MRLEQTKINILINGLSMIALLVGFWFGNNLLNQMPIILSTTSPVADKTVPLEMPSRPGDQGMIVYLTKEEKHKFDINFYCSLSSFGVAFILGALFGIRRKGT